MMQCIAIDDEPLALELLSDFCEKVPFLQLQKKFTRTSDALLYMKSHPVDLLFLDIQMPDVSGIDFYKSLKEKTMVIFTNNDYVIVVIDSRLNYFSKTQPQADSPYWMPAGFHNCHIKLWFAFKLVYNMLFPIGTFR